MHDERSAFSQNKKLKADRCELTARVPEGLAFRDAL
jgi:hypothetical protein